MAEIRFTPTRMRVVCDRLEEIKEQLTSSIKNDAASFETISTVIQSDELSQYLKNYAEGTIEVSNTVVKNLATLKDYLTRQIALYEQSNATTEGSLGEVNSILDQIGNE